MWAPRLGSWTGCAICGQRERPFSRVGVVLKRSTQENCLQATQPSGARINHGRQPLAGISDGFLRVKASMAPRRCVFSQGPIPSLPHWKSLQPLHRRGWSSLYDALAAVQLDESALRRLLATPPTRRRGRTDLCISRRLTHPSQPGDQRLSRCGSGQASPSRTLPRLRPDLNPDEGIWTSLTRVQLGNVCCADLADLADVRRRLLRAASRARHNPDVIRVYSRQCGYWL
jgi:hypothetical protein